MLEPWMIRTGAVLLALGALNVGLLWIEARMRRSGILPAVPPPEPVVRALEALRKSADRRRATETPIRPHALANDAAS
jgi:hypothetical protein